MTRVLLHIELSFLIGVVTLASGCNRGSSETPTQPQTTTTSSTGPTQSYLRVAQLSEDTRFVDVAVNGEVRFRGLDYPMVSDYQTLAAGDYRLQFVSSGTLSPAFLDTTVSLAPGAAVTVAMAGFDSSQVLRTVEDRTVSSGRARVRLASVVPDFPGGLDLAPLGGSVIAGPVGFLGSTGYAEVIPGLYDLELRRNGVGENVAVTYGRSLTAGGSFTAFAIGALRRDSIEIIVVSDARP